PLTSIPKTVQRALIDTEDRRFYQHHGIDPRGTLRALLSESGGSTQGASTLTQQYVKQVRFYQATTDQERADAISQNLDRKIYEAKCAISLEKKYSKDEILGKYLNIAYFGEHSYGIATAAKTYFGKAPSQLTVPEAAVLVGLVKNPTQFDPYENLKAARQRRDQVIDNMATQKDITQQQATTYKQAPIKLSPASKNSAAAQGCAYSNQAIANGGFFCDYVVNWLQNTAKISLDKLNTGGYKIITSLNASLQTSGQKAVWKKYPSSASASVISPSIDPRNGHVLTMITSKRYDNGLLHQSKPDKSYTVNPIFTLARSGSGSTYKYFSLIAALTAGMKPEQTLTTAGSFPSSYTLRNCPELNYKPTNAGAYAPTQSLRSATVVSSNTFFVGVEDQLFDCDLKTIVGTAQRLGMDSLDDQYVAPDGKKNGMTIAQTAIAQSQLTFTLGQIGTSPLELSTAYGVAANDGVLCKPNPVLSITSATGTAVKFTHPACSRVMDPWIARTAVDIMKGDTVNGTAQEYVGPLFYDKYGRDSHYIASKTGTNNAAYQTGPDHGKDNGKNSAIWFVGLTPRLVSATAMVNVDHPTATLQIPGNNSAGDDIFGAYSAQYWIAAYGKYVASQSWHWPSADDIPNGQQVQSVVGQTESEAVSNLKQQGFKPVAYPIPCGSNYFQGTVAYDGPQVAAPGATIYYCMSNGKPLSQPPAKKKKTTTTNSSGGNSGGGTGHTRPGGGGTHGHLWQGAAIVSRGF
ncbi:MAG: transglycosylase domain-containing protein, partial [Jatrophihabitans sp.]